MSDAFIPEADRLDQEREVAPHPTVDEEEGGAGAAGAAPVRVPIEAPEADVLEQSLDVDDDGYD